jgi:hypothetical protein
MRKLITLVGLALLLSTAIAGWAQCTQTYDSHVDDSNFGVGPNCKPAGAGCGSCVDNNGPGGSAETCFLDFSTWDVYCITGPENQIP